MSNLPFQAEYAKSGRSSCKGCKGKIDQGMLRISVMVQSAFFDGKQANWHHEECFFKRQRVQVVSDIANINKLEQKDKERIKDTIDSDNTSSPIEQHYAKLKAEIGPIGKDSYEFLMIKEYVANTHAATHSNYDLEIQEVFKVVRSGEDKRYKPFKEFHNRRLLWHGSRVTNFAGILSQAPPKAPVTGYMFGKGVYFSDMVSKSANYCCTTKQSPVGVLLLCEVALGDMKQCTNAQMVTKLPPGKHSTWGVGRTQPDPASTRILPDDDGTLVPLGKPVSNPVNTSLLYNEFVVYDVAQVNVKYLLEIKFNCKY